MPSVSTDGFSFAGENKKTVKNKKQENITAEKQNPNEIEILKERLKQEIQEERYEDAAKTRDEIKKLEH